MDIGENIRKLRTERDLTQEEFGAIAGVSAMAVSQWENGRAVPRMGAVQRIADYFKISKSAVIDEDSDIQRAKLPTGAMPIYSSSEVTVPLRTLGHVHAGALTDEEEGEQRVEVPASVCARHPHAFALTVDGRCMDRVIPEGAHVLVDPDREPSNGSIAVVETDAYQAVMRRWYRGSSTLMLTADSHEEQEDMVFGPDDGPVRVVGTVVWWQSAEEMG